MGFHRQEYWSGLPFPSPGDLSDPGIEPVASALAGGFFTTKPPGKPSTSRHHLIYSSQHSSLRLSLLLWDFSWTEKELMPTGEYVPLCTQAQFWEHLTMLLYKSQVGHNTCHLQSKANIVSHPWFSFLSSHFTSLVLNSCNLGSHSKYTSQHASLCIRQMFRL